MVDILTVIIVILYSLMGLGGWSILNMWLSDSKKAQNIALLIQLMQVPAAMVVE